MRWLAHVARLRATALAVSGEEAQHVCLPPARPALRWLKSLHALWNGTARARDPRYSVEGRAPMCQLRRSLREPASACSALVRHCVASLWVSGEDAQYARLPRTRATNCAGRGRSMSCGMALYQQEAAILRCKAVLPRASCGVHFASRLARVARVRHLAACLSRGGAARALFARACRELRRPRSLNYPMEGHCTSERPPFFGARPCPHVPAAASTSRAALHV